MKTWMAHLLHKRTKRNLSFILPHIKGQTLLDAGAAEGWNGQLITQQRPECRVNLLDVVNLNRTSLPLTLYDGQTMPFADKTFDTVLLLLTLHHCQDPVRVLRESARVAKNRLIVAESVYRTAGGRWLLKALDYGFNSIRSGQLMPEALYFKTVTEWKALFAQHNLTLTHQIWISKGLHRHIVFVLDVA